MVLEQQIKGSEHTSCAPAPSVKRPGYSERRKSGRPCFSACRVLEALLWRKKVAATADAGADGAASLVFIASPCPLLPEGEIAIYLFTACSFLTAGFAYVENTMEEKNFFGKEYHSVASRSGDSGWREIHSRAHAIDSFGPLDKKTGIAGRRDKRRDYAAPSPRYASRTRGSASSVRDSPSSVIAPDSIT